MFFWTLSHTDSILIRYRNIFMLTCNLVKVVSVCVSVLQLPVASLCNLGEQVGSQGETLYSTLPHESASTLMDLQSSLMDR